VAPLSKFTKSLIFNEKYYLYLVSPAATAWLTIYLCQNFWSLGT
jgi:hypothetical protein